MNTLSVIAYWQLMRFDLHIARKKFGVLYDTVRKQPVQTHPTYSHSIESICLAMDNACIWYWRKAQCLQRSAATACLLRKCGVPARLVIGATQIPFRCHAWVEVEGVVVNDKPYVGEMYAVLDRC